MRKPIVAIDGTAASGKSTTAQRVAEHFQYRYVDTGAMYRAVTLKALQEGIDPTDSLALSNLVDNVDIHVEQQNGRIRVFLDQLDVTEQIRSPEVTQHVSAVSDIPHVREVLVTKQRELGKEGGIVMEGRDIGTVVFPHADVKVYMVADSHERARRRQQELGQQARDIKSEKMEKSIVQRDTWDSLRIHSPLQRAPDAQLLDTTHLSIDEQVKVVVHKIERILRQNTRGS